VDELHLEVFDAVVYHCVDDLATVPRMTPVVRELEETLARRANRIFASAPVLADRLASRNPETYLLPNVADIHHFAFARRGAVAPGDIVAVPAPRVVYTGALSDYKVDWHLIEGVARALPQVSFAFIGPSGEETRNTATRPVRRLANCYFMGLRDYASLPTYLAHCQAAIVPYRITPHTDAVYPLKIVEYAAAGLPVIATPLPALTARPELPIITASSRVEFADGVRTALARPEAFVPPIDALSAYSWDALLADLMTRLVDVE